MIGSFLVWYIVFVFSTTCHEAAHAFLAMRGGDQTAYEGGQVSLDPVPHMRREPIGMIVVPIIVFLFAGGGWMIGWASAPFNLLWAQRYPRRYALMSLAGPAANALLAVVAFAILRGLVAVDVFTLNPNLSYDQLVALPGQDGFASPLGAVAMLLSVMLSLNVILGLFNLMPIPPLDGAGVLEGASPDRFGRLYQKLREVPMFGLVGLLIAWNVFPYISTPVLGFVIRGLYGL